MSQELRLYPTCRVDGNDNEARHMNVTATVGPTGNGEIDATRGVQLTLHTPNGYAYARVSEPQIRDLIRVLHKRVDPDAACEATGMDADTQRVYYDGKREDESL
jgi:hypothetical protein